VRRRPRRRTALAYLPAWLTEELLASYRRAFIDRGALAFVGGLTVEDVLLNTPMYVAFLQALVLKGQSVGEALRAARNQSLIHVALLNQAEPAAFWTRAMTSATICAPATCWRSTTR